MFNILEKFPPIGEKIMVSLRRSNGEHQIYECIYMGVNKEGKPIFKFISNDVQYACEIFTEVNEKFSKTTALLLGREIIGWWKPKEKYIRKEITDEE